MLHLIERSRQVGSHAHVRLVISNKASAKGIGLARSHGVETLVIPHAGITRQEFEEKMSIELEKREIHLICLAGFMRILTPTFVQHWQRRIINIHPSILPAFKGAEAVKLALQAGVKVTGCSVHYTVEEVDSGEILGQDIVRVEPDDTEESLHKKIQEKEHQLFPAIMEEVARGMALGEILPP